MKSSCYLLGLIDGGLRGERFATRGLNFERLK